MHWSQRGLWWQFKFLILSCLYTASWYIREVGQTFKKATLKNGCKNDIPDWRKQWLGHKMCSHTYRIYLSLSPSCEFSRSFYKDSHESICQKSTAVEVIHIIKFLLYVDSYLVTLIFSPCPRMFYHRTLQESLKRERGSLIPLFDFSFTRIPGKRI